MRFYFIKKNFNDQTVKLMVLSFAKTVINPLLCNIASLQ